MPVAIWVAIFVSFYVVFFLPAIQRASEEKERENNLI